MLQTLRIEENPEMIYVCNHEIVGTNLIGNSIPSHFGALLSVPIFFIYFRSRNKPLCLTLNVITYALHGL